MSKILVNLDNVVGCDRKDIYKALFDLADEINADLDGYKVTFVHSDTGDFLSFEPRDRPKTCPECGTQIDDNMMLCVWCENKEALAHSCFVESQPG